MKKLELIQASRAIVPLLVAIVHIAGTMQVKYNYNFLGLSDLDKSGGVDYFFALTGFMMFFVYQKKFGDKSFYKPFLYNRFARLYPFYWALAIPLIPFFYFIPELGRGMETNLVYLLKSLLLLPQEQGPYIFVAWSLSFNVLFYLVFAALLRHSKKVFYTSLGAWAVIIGFVALLPNVPFFIDFLFSTNFINFIAGVLVASLVVKFKGFKRHVFLLVAGILVFCFNWINVIQLGLDININALYLVSAVLVIAGLSGIDLNRDIKVGSSMSFLGNASFAIYLSHTLTISVATKALDMLGLSNDINPMFMGLALLVGSVIVGGILYQFLEKPIHKQFKSKKLFKSSARETAEVSTH